MVDLAYVLSPWCSTIWRARPSCAVVAAVDRLVAVMGILLYVALSWVSMGREFLPRADGFWAPSTVTLSPDDVGCGVMNTIRPSPQSFGA
jgi:hypothetical protein